jgi:16S rRNA (cytosine967-C5)-methyltransferase
LVNLVKSCLAWPEAVRLLARWLAERERIDGLMDELPSGMDPVERARCQHLVFGVIRHAGRLEGEITRLVVHPPRFLTRAVLCVLGYELIEAAETPEAWEGQVAKIVHHAVEQTKGIASPAEARLVNAVGRKLAVVLKNMLPPAKLAPAAVLAEYYSHPEWLVQRWLTAFGAAATRELLDWNQKPALVYARWRAASAPSADGVSVPALPAVALAEEGPPFWLKATDWSEFYAIEGRHWPEVEAEIAAGRLYVQDPATRLAVDELDPQPGETWLDACAAPGGKSLFIADRAGSGRLIALDRIGAGPDDKKRFARFRANLQLIHGVTTTPLELDLLGDLKGALQYHKLPTSFAGVLVDAPCSNTGVMRHRVDVKWRLQEGDLGRHAEQQKALLAAASQVVAPGGRLVYSTCSIDPEENEGVVAAFLLTHPTFKLEHQVLARPWEAGHDGAGVFRLIRVAERLQGVS